MKIQHFFTCKECKTSINITLFHYHFLIYLTKTRFNGDLSLTIDYLLKKYLSHLYLISETPTKRTLTATYQPRTKNYVIRKISIQPTYWGKLCAGTIIFAMSIVIWALTYFPHDEEAANKHIQPFMQELETLIRMEEEDLKNGNPFPERRIQIELLQKEIEKEMASFHLSNSYLGRMGKFVEPVFRPLGFDWKLSVGILAAFPAREVIISTLGIIYNVGEANEESESLRTKLLNEKFPDGTPVYTPLTAISLMVFFALCVQCMSTLAVIKKELGDWKYPVYVFLYMTSLAYIVALIVYQTGKWLFY